MAEKKRKGEGNLSHFFAKRVKADSSDTLGDEVEGGNFDAGASSVAFQQLLDFSLVNSEEEIAKRFNLIAKTLIHGFRLVVKTESKQEIEFQIMEAEFYLQVDTIHEDPFTHGSEEQKFSGGWYFHRAPMFSKDSHRSLTSTSAYRDGSRKGMDLTLGGPPLNTVRSASPGPFEAPGAPASDGRLLRGGILLRTLREVTNNKVTSGPSLLVDRILAASGASSIEDLVKQKWNGNTSAFLSNQNPTTTCLYMKPIAHKHELPMYFSPRIGLDLSHPGTTDVHTLPLHPRIRFLPKRYRFFVRPELLVANGRPQSFLGVLDSRFILPYPISWITEAIFKPRYF